MTRKVNTFALVESVNLSGRVLYKIIFSVDGGISQWSAYGPCEDGKRKRTRSCTDPAPAFGGADCGTFDSEEEIRCNGI